MGRNDSKTGIVDRCRLDFIGAQPAFGLSGIVYSNHSWFNLCLAFARPTFKWTFCSRTHPSINTIFIFWPGSYSPGSEWPEDRASIEFSGYNWKTNRNLSVGCFRSERQYLGKNASLKRI